MADKVLITKSKLTAIADKIRKLKGTTKLYTLDEIPPIIEDEVWIKVFETSVTINTSSTTETSAGTFTIDMSQIPFSQFDMRIDITSRTKTSGTCFGSDSYLPFLLKTSTTERTHFGKVYGKWNDNGGKSLYYNSGTTAYGVYPTGFTPSTGVLKIYRRYNSTYTGTINATFDIVVSVKKVLI